MARLRDVEMIFQDMDKHGLKCWQVYDQQKRLLGFSDNEDLLVDRAIGDLRDKLNGLEGLVTVKLRERPGNKGGNVRSVIEHEIILGDNNAYKSAAAPNINGVGISKTELVELLAERENQLRQEFKKEKEIDDLKRQLAEAKQVTFTDQLIQGLAPILINKFGGGFMNPAPAVAGHGESIDNDQVRINTAINKLLSLDPDFITHLEQLANLAENKPAMYSMALTMLENEK